MRIIVVAGAVGALVFLGVGCVQREVPLPASEPTTNEAPVFDPITITLPAADAPVGNPIIASGNGIAFENTIQLRVRDANERVIGESFATAYAPLYTEPGPWRAAIAYEQSATKTGFLEAYESSAKDGSELHLVRVPIQFSQDTIPIQIALIDAVAGEPGSGPDCPMRIEHATYRIPRTKAVARAAVEALLASPPPIPPTNPKLFSALAWTHADLRGITITNGIATVDLSLGVLEETSDRDADCRAQQRMAQLRATLPQFPTIREVRVLINGRTHPLFK